MQKSQILISGCKKLRSKEIREKIQALLVKVKACYCSLQCKVCKKI